MRLLHRKQAACGLLLAGAMSLCAGAMSVRAQQTPVTSRVELVERNAGNRSEKSDAAEVVVSLVPVDNGVLHGGDVTPSRAPQLIQRNKAFEPHVLAVQVGTLIQFPNKDPFLHNVFSLFDGKRFDLGFYEAGSSRSVRFDRPGVSYLFCNIHPDMSALVVAVATPYFGISDHSGRVTIPGVPNGRYRVQVWYERSLPEDLQSLTRMVSIDDAARELEPIRVMINPKFTLAHKNKYGQDYVPPTAGITY